MTETVRRKQDIKTLRATVHPSVLRAAIVKANQDGYTVTSMLSIDGQLILLLTDTSRADALA